MATLSIDTSSSLLSVAVLSVAEQSVAEQSVAEHGDNQKTILEYEESIGHNHAESLSKACDEILKQAGIGYSDIKKIVLGSGPGSFTGLRIGYAYAKGIACALNVPVVSICTFEAFSSFDESIKLIVGDARSNLYFTKYKNSAVEMLEKKQLLEFIAVNNINRIISLDIMPIELSGLEVCRPSSIAKNLIRLEQHSKSEPQTKAQLSEITPLYIRPINAKTILERNG